MAGQLPRPVRASNALDLLLWRVPVPRVVLAAEGLEKAWQSGLSIKRYATKRDDAEPEIVRDLRKCGVVVFPLDEPFDLLTYWRGRWQPLEVKSDTGKRTRNQSRDDALAPIPIVRNFNEACQAIGLSFGYGPTVTEIR